MSEATQQYDFKPEYSMDWLRFSVSTLCGVCGEALPAQSCFEPTLEKITPLPFYNRAFKLPIGRVDWNTDRPEQRKLVTLSGDDLREYVRLGGDIDYLLRWVHETPGRNVTRIDFAIDCMGDRRVTPSHIAEAWRGKKIATRAKKCTMLHSERRGGENAGYTVYLGNRQSEQLLRVYDKSKQLDTDEPWVRIEIEVKGDRANSMLADMVKHGVEKTGCAAVRKYARIPTVGWYEYATEPGNGDYIEPVSRKPTNWELWLESVVIPNVQKAIDSDVPGVLEKVESMVAAARAAGK